MKGCNIQRMFCVSAVSYSISIKNDLVIHNVYPLPLNLVSWWDVVKKQKLM